MIVVREKRNEIRDSIIEGIFDTFKLKQDDFMNMVSDGFEHRSIKFLPVLVKFIT